MVASSSSPAPSTSASRSGATKRRCVGMSARSSATWCASFACSGRSSSIRGGAEHQRTDTVIISLPDISRHSPPKPRPIRTSSLTRSRKVCARGRHASCIAGHSRRRRQRFRCRRVSSILCSAEPTPRSPLKDAASTSHRIKAPSKHSGR